MYLTFCIIYDFQIILLVKSVIYTKICLNMMIKNNCLMRKKKFILNDNTTFVSKFNKRDIFVKITNPLITPLKTERCYVYNIFTTNHR